MNQHYNLVALEGYVSRDAELKFTGGKSTPYITFSIAHRFISYKNNQKTQEVDFYDVVAWESIGQKLAEFIKKGKHIIVTGRQRIDRYINKEGKEKMKVEITANNISFVSTRYKEKNQTNQMKMAS